MRARSTRSLTSLLAWQPIVEENFSSFSSSSAGPFRRKTRSKREKRSAQKTREKNSHEINKMGWNKGRERERERIEGRKEGYGRRLLPSCMNKIESIYIGKDIWYYVNQGQAAVCVWEKKWGDKKARFGKFNIFPLRSRTSGCWFFLRKDWNLRFFRSDFSLKLKNYGKMFWIILLKYNIFVWDLLGSFCFLESFFFHLHLQHVGFVKVKNPHFFIFLLSSKSFKSPPLVVKFSVKWFFRDEIFTLGTP